jgi:GNAT superfamily N-acetyltransferase
VSKTPPDQVLPDDSYLALQIDQQIHDIDAVDSDLDPERFIHHTSGRVAYVSSSGEFVLEVGTFSVIQVDLEAAVTHRADVYQMFDIEATTFGYYEALYEHDDCHLTPAASKAARNDGAWDPNLLILDRLIILPAFRGQGVGLLALRGLMERFGFGVGIVAMKPYPLQHEAHYLDEAHASERAASGLDAFSGSVAAATSKLRNYYGRLGFRRVVGTDYMVRSTLIPLPSPDELFRCR